MTNAPAHIYVIEFSDGTIKVGYSANPDIRMAEHARSVKTRGARITRSWVSDAHTNAMQNEVALIKFCRDQGDEPLGRSKEYFANVTYDDALVFAQSLPQTPHVGHPVVSLTRGRQMLMELADAALYRGQVTIITRGNKAKPAAAIVPINRIAEEQTVTVAEIAREFNVTEADVLALADQLTTLDGSENVVASEENGVVTLTADAAAVIRDQLNS